MKEENNITIFIGGLSEGGAERVVCNLANYLVERNWKVNILTMSDKKSTHFLHTNVKRYALIRKYERKSLIYNFLIRYLRLKKYIETEEADCFIVMLPITTVMLLSLRRHIKGKVIASERCNPIYCPRHIQIMIKMLANKADGYVFQTEENYKWYVPYINKRSKAMIIPNAINEEFLLDCEKITKENRIVAVGRLSSQKNFPLLVKAYARIVRKYHDYKVFIFGDGAEKSNLEKLIKELNLENNVKLAGFTENIKDELQKAKIFVMPSDFEGMPNALIEAMALGLPCVATDCAGGGARFLIQHGINGYLVEPGNVEQMAHYMDLLLSSEELAEHIGNNAKKVTETLNPNRIYSAWEDFIKSVIEIV
ncbi:MAG: glycosyltransferase family 4 protein [Clostridiales bacterium]|nr:glycosyltransferase family 4 protein [Clostridiales bacterium]